MDGLYIIIAIAAFLLGGVSQRLANQEKKYNELAVKTGNAHLATTFISDKKLEAVINLKAQGKKVQAVKYLRSVTDKGLLEAKQYVDKL